MAVAQDTDTPGYGLEEIVATASRRSESSQDVAIALQAISESKLEELRIDSFDDYVSLIPGVNASGQGPGSKKFSFVVSPPVERRLESLAWVPSLA